MRRRMVGFGLVALVCVFGTACGSSSSSKSGESSATTTTTSPGPTTPGATTPGATVDPALGPDPCQALTVGDLEGVFGAGVSNGARSTTNPGWCVWTITGGAQVTFQYPGVGAKYAAKTPNAVAALNKQRSNAGNTKDAPGAGDAAYFVVLDSTLVVAKAPDTLFSVHYEAGLPTDDGILVPQLTRVANALLGAATR